MKKMKSILSSVICLAVTMSGSVTYSASKIETKEETLARICSGGVVNSVIEAEMAQNFCLENKVDFNLTYARVQILEKQVGELQKQVDEYQNSISRGIYKKIQTYDISDPMMAALFSTGVAADLIALKMMFSNTVGPKITPTSVALISYATVSIGIWLLGVDHVKYKIHSWASGKLNVTPENIKKVQEILAIVKSDLTDRKANLQTMMNQK